MASFERIQRSLVEAFSYVGPKTAGSERVAGGPRELGGASPATKRLGAASQAKPLCGGGREFLF